MTVLLAVTGAIAEQTLAEQFVRETSAYAPGTESLEIAAGAGRDPATGALRVGVAAIPGATVADVARVSTAISQVLAYRRAVSGEAEPMIQAWRRELNTAVKLMRQAQPLLTDLSDSAISDLWRRHEDGDAASEEAEAPGEARARMTAELEKSGQELAALGPPERWPDSVAGMAEMAARAARFYAVHEWVTSVAREVIELAGGTAAGGAGTEREEELAGVPGASGPRAFRRRNLDGRAGAAIEGVAAARPRLVAGQDELASELARALATVEDLHGRGAATGQELGDQRDPYELADQAWKLCCAGWWCWRTWSDDPGGRAQ